MPLSYKIRLCVMMALQFAMYGIWIIPLATLLKHCGYSGLETGLAYSTPAWGGILAPLVVGIIADRYFASQRILGVLNLVGAALLFAATQVVVGSERQPQPWLLFWFLLGHCVCYMPTWSLTASIALSHCKDVSREFPLIRSMGTIGWIAVSTLSLAAFLNEWTFEETLWPMYIGAGIGVVAGLTNFFLPHTPPKAAGVKMSLADLLGLRAAHLLTDANFAIFVLCSFLIMIPAQFYWVFTNPFLKHLGFQAPQALQSLAQVSELAFMFVMPLALVWLRVRWLLLVGLLAWVLRFALLAYGNAEASVWTIYLALLMHGGCFAFFFIGGQLYVDRKAPKELQASAQGFIAFITWGLGQLAGAYVAGAALDYFKIAGTSGAPQIDWHNYWLTAAALAVGVSLLFLAFREKISLAGEEPAAETAPLPERLDT